MPSNYQGCHRVSSSLHGHLVQLARHPYNSPAWLIGIYHPCSSRDKGFKAVRFPDSSERDAGKVTHGQICFKGGRLQLKDTGTSPEMLAPGGRVCSPGSCGEPASPAVQGSEQRRGSHSRGRPGRQLSTRSVSPARALLSSTSFPSIRLSAAGAEPGDDAHQLCTQAASAARASPVYFPNRGFDLLFLASFLPFGPPFTAYSHGHSSTDTLTYCVN